MFGLYIRHLVIYGLNPNNLRLVCRDWNESMVIMHRETVRNITLANPNNPNQSILMFLSASSPKVFRRILFGTIRNIIDWNIFVYTIYDKEKALILHERINNRHTSELCRVLSIPQELPLSKGYLLTSCIGDDIGTAYRSLSQIIRGGYLEAFKCISDKIHSKIIMTAISLVSNSQDLFINYHILDTIYPIINYTCDIKRNFDSIIISIQGIRGTGNQYNWCPVFSVSFYDLHRLPLYLFDNILDKKEHREEYLSMFRDLDISSPSQPNIRVLRKLRKYPDSSTEALLLALERGWQEYL